MIKIERSSSISVHEQLVEQLRYQIASGTYKVNDILPPTRKLAEQLGISFHTVRKAYQKLVEEGILSAQQGSGYTVLARAPLSNEERLEKGASIVQETLQRLVGLGLEDTDIEYLVQEQLTIFDAVTQGAKVVFVAPYLEMAEQCASYISSVLQSPIEFTTLPQLDHHQDADFCLCPHAYIRRITEAFPRVDVLGTTSYLLPSTLDRIAHLFSQETVGLITFYKETIPFLMSDIQSQTGFTGQIFGASLEEGTAHLNQFIDQTDLIVFTPRCKRRLISFTKQDKTFAPLYYIVSAPSIKAIQELIPSL